MYILKILNIIAVIYLLFMIFSWKPGFPVSPRESFQEVKTACKSNNTAKLAKLLSRHSKAKILRVIDTIKRLPEESKIAFARKFSLNYSKLNKLTVEDYLKIELFLNKKFKTNNKIISDKHIISRIDIKNNLAIINTNHNIKLTFVKEGPYWFYNLNLNN